MFTDLTNNLMSCACIRTHRTEGIEIPAADEDALIGVPVKALQVASDTAISTADLVLSKTGEVTHGLALDFVMLGDQVATDTHKIYGGGVDPPKGCFDCTCMEGLKAFAAITAFGSNKAVGEARARRFSIQTMAKPPVGIHTILALQRLRRKAAKVAHITRDLSSFVGRWQIASEIGRLEYLGALDLNWVVRRVAANMPTPPIHFFLDDQMSLHSQQGPLFGRMVVSVHPQKSHTHTEEFQGVVSEITSTWEDGQQGRPVLVCRTTTIGKKDVCDQRSYVDVNEAGQPTRLTVETRLTPTPGAPTVVYDRVYEPLAED